MVSFFGVVLLLIAVVLPLRSVKIGSEPRLRRSVLAVLACKQAVTWLQITVGPLPTVNGDPIGFNTYAMGQGAEALAGNPFAEFLRGSYKVLGGSHLLGCEINQVGFSLALVFFIEILFLLGCQSIAPRMVIIFGLLPSVALNTSVVLREGWQMAGFLGLVLGLLETRRNGLAPRTALVPISALLLIPLQNGFAPYLILVMPMAVLWSVGSRPWLIMAIASFCLFVAVLFGQRVVEHLERNSAVLQQVSGGDGLEYIGGYQERVNHGRSDFATKLDINSTAQLLRTGPIVLLQYLFAPMPWQVRGLLDLYGLFESFVRVWIFGQAIRGIRLASGEQRGELFFLAGMFLSLEVAWAAGTANWGTAFRHRVVGWGVLVALGAVGLGRGGAMNGSRKSTQSLRQSVRERRRQLSRRRDSAEAVDRSVRK